MADKFPWFPLARQALNAAIDDDHDAAVAAVEELAGTFGPDVMPQVLLALVDTMLASTIVPASPDALAFLNAGTGEIQGADEVPPAIRWAGRLTMARALDDRDTFEALIDSVETDEQWSDNCSAVLSLCAVNIKLSREASRG